MYDCHKHELTVIATTSERLHAIAFAKSVFADAITSATGTAGGAGVGGVLTKTGVRTYFKGHPIEMAHLMSERFAWSLFFTAKMEANQVRRDGRERRERHS